MRPARPSFAKCRRAPCSALFVLFKKKTIVLTNARGISAGRERTVCKIPANATRTGARACHREQSLPTTVAASHPWCGLKNRLAAGKYIFALLSPRGNRVRHFVPTMDWNSRCHRFCFGRPLIATAFFPCRSILVFFSFFFTRPPHPLAGLIASPCIFRGRQRKSQAQLSPLQATRFSKALNDSAIFTHLHWPSDV